MTKLGAKPAAPFCAFAPPPREVKAGRRRRASRKRYSFLALMLVASAAMPGSAFGDSTTAENNFGRDRNVSVRGRAKPEYDTSGIRLGAFTLTPAVALEVEYTDNVFAAQTDQQSSFIYTITPSLALGSNWGANALSVSVAAPSSHYSEFSDQNTDDLLADVAGRLDFSRSLTFNGDVHYTDAHEALQDAPTADNLAKPVEYTSTVYHVGALKTFNRLRLRGEAWRTGYNYQDGVLVGGGALEQDDRDEDVNEFLARADYAISPATAVFVSVRRNEHDYRLDPPSSNPNVTTNRDSQGYEYLVGANFDYSRLVRGEIGVGTLQQSYDSGEPDTKGLAVQSKVEWFPDELFTVTFAASRSVVDAGVVDATSSVENSASIQIDYEFRRNIVFGLGADYSKGKFQGIDREDTRNGVQASVDYLLDRGVSAFAQASSISQDSTGSVPGRIYDADQVVIGLRLRR